MVEVGIGPIIESMAGSTVRCGKGGSGRGMHRIRRLLPIRQVTGRARRREPQIIPNRRVCMALLAFHHSMRAEQWKSVEVQLNRLHGHPPAQNRVALGAVGPELRAVNVGMTIGAFLSDVSENRLAMAPRAGYFFVHPT